MSLPSLLDDVPSVKSYYGILTGLTALKQMQGREFCFSCNVTGSHVPTTVFHSLLVKVRNMSWFIEHQFSQGPQKLLENANKSQIKVIGLFASKVLHRASRLFRAFGASSLQRGCR
uniref:Uncharacterized protein n=1 Tax=Physcomitrium patens TaxID=3218 RepID=A0A2K1IIT2_PHYPA|nr:hypothetical protein PHYPA_027878 [Physcomitrium patens]